MIKKQAIYRVTVYINKNTIIVTSPLTAQMNITRSIMSDSTRATIKLYNLAPSTRNSIFQDVFTYDYRQWKYVHVEAGYGDEKSMSMIFKGRISQAYSYKSGGQTDVITEIQAQALDIFDCQTSRTVEAGTSKREAVFQCVNDFPNVTLGNVGAIDGNFLTSTTFDGNTLNCINEITGGRAFVDNGQLNILLENEVIDVPVPVITDETGLLETPVRRDANLTIKTLFQPDLIVGQLLEVKSRISPNFNGQFKVIGFSHDLTFGDGISGTRTTTVDLWILPLLPGADVMLTKQKNYQPSKVKGLNVESVLMAEPSDARATYNYIQKHNGNLPNTKITKSISWKDMLGHNNTNAERLSECTLAVCTNAWVMAQRLQERVLNKYYNGRKVNITSGWRSRRNNSSVKGAPDSRHLYGLAIDFTIPSIPLKSIAARVKPTFDFNLVEASWVHVQLEPGKRHRVNDK